MVFALVVMAVTSATLYAAMLRVRHGAEQEARHSRREGMRREADSGLALLAAASASADVGYGAFPIPRSLEHVLPRTVLSRHRWGLYDLHRAVVTDGTGAKATKAELVGARRIVQPVLTALDRGNRVMIAGSASVRGDVAVPGGRLKPRVLAGERAPPRGGHVGRSRTAPPRLPRLDRERIFFFLRAPRDPEAAVALASAADTVITGEHLVLRASEPHQRVAYLATDRIHVEPLAELHHSLLCAPAVTIGAGVRGSAQAFAGDTLAVGDGVRLTRASALVAGEHAAALLLPRNAHVSGAIVHASTRKDRLSLGLHPDSSVEGLVYATGVAALRGRIAARVYVGQLGYLPTEAPHVNTLYDVELDTLPTGLSVPLGLAAASPAYPQSRFQ